MVVVYICPICKKTQYLNEPYVGMETEEMYTFGIPCPSCKQEKLTDKTLIMEKPEINDKYFPEIIAIQDVEFRQFFKTEPPVSKILIVKKGFLTGRGFFQGVHFGKTSH